MGQAAIAGSSDTWADPVGVTDSEEVLLAPLPPFFRKPFYEIQLTTLPSAVTSSAKVRINLQESDAAPAGRVAVKENPVQ